MCITLISRLTYRNRPSKFQRKHYYHNDHHEERSGKSKRNIKCYFLTHTIVEMCFRQTAFVIQYASVILRKIVKNINRNVSHRIRPSNASHLSKKKNPHLLYRCFEYYLTFKMADIFAWLLQTTSCIEMPAHKSGVHAPFIDSNFLQIPMQNCLVFRLNV